MNSDNEAYLISICQGPECRKCGGPELLEQTLKMGLQALNGHCHGLCHFAPIVYVNQRCIAEATTEKIMQARSSDIP